MEKNSPPGGLNRLQRNQPLLILRDAAILWVLLLLSQLLPQNTGGDADLAAGVFFWVLGFTLSAVLTQNPRWRHLALVGLAFWSTMLPLPIALGKINVISWWLTTSLHVAFAALIGGALSYIFKPSNGAKAAS